MHGPLLIFQSKYGDFGQSVAKKAIYRHRVKMIGVQSCKHFGCQRSQMPNVAPFGCRGNMELGGLTFR